MKTLKRPSGKSKTKPDIREILASQFLYAVATVFVKKLMSQWEISKLPEATKPLKPSKIWAEEMQEKWK